MDMNDFRTAYHNWQAIEQAAYKIASEVIPVGCNTYLSVDNISFDDDEYQPTVVIMCSEKWQGNQEDTTIAILLEEFITHI